MKNLKIIQKINFREIQEIDFREIQKIDFREIQKINYFLEKFKIIKKKFSSNFFLIYQKLPQKFEIFVISKNKTIFLLFK